ncbi:hypothetical protein SAMN05444955_108231 [Lihuaxuella thermophila]|uniref:Uncharacterized protein n=1 Tax=Lihuaxuella thermophila TaxID=1173111 RepID=A0A1H8FK59_9BACL|nr:hypothetical protein SAMN05444955_108231 [Lihuaxuella thermophila]
MCFRSLVMNLFLIHCLSVFLDLDDVMCFLFVKQTSFK